MDWSRPLGHGPGFFLAFEVPPRLLCRCRRSLAQSLSGVLLVEWAIEWIALVSLIASGQSRWLPCWAGGSAVLYVASLSLFGLVASRNLGRAGGQPAVALSFEERRLRDYLSPSAEGLVIALLGASWLLLAVRVTPASAGSSPSSRPIS